LEQPQHLRQQRLAALRPVQQRPDDAYVPQLERLDPPAGGFEPMVDARVACLTHVELLDQVGRAGRLAVDDDRGLGCRRISTSEHRGRTQEASYHDRLLSFERTGHGRAGDEQ